MPALSMLQPHPFLEPLLGRKHHGIDHGHAYIGLHLFIQYGRQRRHVSITKPSQTAMAHATNAVVSAGSNRGNAGGWTDLLMDTTKSRGIVLEYMQARGSAPPGFVEWRLIRVGWRMRKDQLCSTCTVLVCSLVTRMSLICMVSR